MSEDYHFEGESFPLPEPGEDKLDYDYFDLSFNKRYWRNMLQVDMVGQTAFLGPNEVDRLITSLQEIRSHMDDEPANDPE